MAINKRVTVNNSADSKWEYLCIDQGRLMSCQSLSYAFTFRRKGMKIFFSVGGVEE